MPTALEALNRLDRDAFVRALGAVVERSPWVAERAWAARPFASLADLHGAMRDAVRAAPAAERLALLRAHPDLAGRAARAGALTEASRTEQAGAGLDRLSDAEAAAFERLNAAYRARFGFPFILCVRNHPRVGDILGALEQRLGHSVEDEVETALGEVAEIARHRLLAWAG
jgi:2-oxo-4-hydroxy-4-carboxy-5-ureidoimidazoline decarboxylase